MELEDLYCIILYIYILCILWCQWCNINLWQCVCVCVWSYLLLTAGDHWTLNSAHPCWVRFFLGGCHLHPRPSPPAPYSAPHRNTIKLCALAKVVQFHWELHQVSQSRPALEDGVVEWAFRKYQKELLFLANSNLRTVDEMWMLKYSLHGWDVLFSWLWFKYLYFLWLTVLLSTAVKPVTVFYQLKKIEGSLNL